MSIGTVKFFNAGKGFGFVTPDGGGPDIFLPSASVTSSGLTGVKPGQRVTFEQAPDPKGTKIVSLKLIAEAPRPPVPVPVPVAECVTVFCDFSSPVAAEILESAAASGLRVVPLDYTVTPLTIEQLQRLSHQINHAGQTLVRRYDPLFSALQLDDRFIGTQDFWTGIIEHPALINGPVLVRGNAARICKTASEVRAFLNRGEADIAAHSKTLSPRVAALLRGEAPSTAALDAVPEISVPEAVPEPKARKAVVKLKAAVAKTPVKPKKKAAPPAKEKKAAARPAAKKASKPIKSGKPAKKKVKKR